jgi:hypothetical protein
VLCSFLRSIFSIVSSFSLLMKSSTNSIKIKLWKKKLQCMTELYCFVTRLVGLGVLVVVDLSLSFSLSISPCLSSVVRPPNLCVVLQYTKLHSLLLLILPLFIHPSIHHCRLVYCGTSMNAKKYAYLAK